MTYLQTITSLRDRLGSLNLTNHLVNEVRLGIVNFGITERCDFQCKFCGRWKKPVVELFDLDRYKHLIDELTRFKIHPAKLRLAGGEVLMIEELPELVAHASDRGWFVEICTNAYYLNENMARRLGEARVSLVAISLDSLNERKHDRLRGKEGAYRRVMQAVRLLHTHAPSVYVSFMTLIIKQNIDDLVALVKWVGDSDMVGGVFFQALYSNLGDDWLYRYTNEQFKGLVPEVGRVGEVVGTLIALKEQGAKIENEPAQLAKFIDYYEEPFFHRRGSGCPVADYTAIVDEFGGVRFCPYEDPIGNAFERPIGEILHSDRAAQQKKTMNGCTKYCYSLINCLFDED